MASNRGTYAKVAAEDAVDAHDDSSTVVGETTPTMHAAERLWDEDVSRRPCSKRSRLQRTCSSIVFQALLNAFLLFLVMGLLLDRYWHKEKYGYFQSGGDITEFLPRIPQKIKSFVPETESFAPENASDFFSPQIQKNWLGLVPEGLGYVKVDHPSQYDNLPHPVKGYNETVFTTSVTHQLHCLYNIAEVYSSLASGKEIPVQMHGHIPHCIEYLRQAIMCCGDTALEGQHTTFPEGVIGTDGWDATHVCKDYDQIFKVLEKNRVNDESWI